MLMLKRCAGTEVLQLFYLGAWLHTHTDLTPGHSSSPTHTFAAECAESSSLLPHPLPCLLPCFPGQGAADAPEPGGPGSVVVRPDGSVCHVAVECDACGTCPIVGTRCVFVDLGAGYTLCLSMHTRHVPYGAPPWGPGASCGPGTVRHCLFPVQAK